MAAKPTDLLRKMDIFEGLSDDDLLKISRLLKERRFAEEQVLFRQGDVGDALYIVLEGRIKIATTDQFGREKVLAFYGEGEFFGEMAVLTGAPRSATAHATSTVKVYQLRKDDFDLLLATNAEVMKELLRVVAQRQAVANQRLSQEAQGEGNTRLGRLCVVFSPRGGAGRSTVAINVAITLAHGSPDRVVLADLDLLFGHVPVMLNLQPRTALGAASPAALQQMDRESFKYYLTPHEDSSLRVLVGAMRPEEGELVTAEHVRAGLSLLQGQFVQVLVDTARNFSDPTLAAIEMADEVYIIVTPELTCVRDARECRRIFEEILGLPPQRFRYVLNHLSPYDGLSRDQVEKALGVEMSVEIPYGGDAPAKAALEGAPLITRSPSNPASKAIAEIAARIELQTQEALALSSR